MADGVPQLEHLYRTLRHPRYYLGLDWFVFKTHYRANRRKGVRAAIAAGWKAVCEPIPF